MRHLGIDYGSKRVGLAISDEGNTVAFPKAVIAGGSGLLEELCKIATEEKISAIVLGESKNYDGEDNLIMEGARALKKKLEEELNIPVIFEPEFLTSVQAGRQGETSMLDASAAAIILQSYLDKINNKSDERRDNNNW